MRRSRVDRSLDERRRVRRDRRDTRRQLVDALTRYIEAPKSVKLGSQILTRHHLYFPKNDYLSALEQKFRNLDCNIVLIPDCVHTMLHKLQSPPKKPSREYMEAMIGLYRTSPPATSAD